MIVSEKIEPIPNISITLLKTIGHIQLSEKSTT